MVFLYEPSVETITNEWPVHPTGAKVCIFSDAFSGASVDEREGSNFLGGFLPGIGG